LDMHTINKGKRGEIIQIHVFYCKYVNRKAN
jgi:hypothetical protein